MPQPPNLPPRLRLVLLSFLMLFVELALIRWTGSNVLYLAYFSNFVLLGSFLGIGIGFLRARARIDLFNYAPIALALFIGFVLIFPVEIDRSGSDLIYFGAFQPTGLPIWLTLPLIFGAVAVVMAMIAEGVARTFVEFEALEAYRLDIAGSICGIAAFSVLSFAWAPPLAWALVVAMLFAVLLPGSPRWTLNAARAVALVGLVFMLGRESIVPEWSWSPYYKIEVVEEPDGPYHYTISANGVPHQAIIATTDREAVEPIYFLPYEHVAGNRLRNVLIIGAGNGNDVATALAMGAQHIDAVEIDPRLLQLGRDLHPDRPYADPRVDRHVNDGRAFLEQTDTRYDLIIFALPDSLTLVSGQSSIRLESYLFTREAISAAREHIAPGGAFSMYNFYRERWLVDRYAGTLASVFAVNPCIDDVGAGQLAALTVTLDPADLACTTAWAASGQVPEPATDDHPFPYLRQAGLPAFYLITIGLILLASVGLVRAAAGSLRPMRGYLDLAAMGAAFLLLETKSVVQFALLFGTTWFVNALVFGGVLVSVLAAIEATRRVRILRPGVLYVALLAALLIAWLLPAPALLHLDFWPRLLVAASVAFLPIFLANLVFAGRFRDVGDTTGAFGANLLGAMAGGLIEYVALVTGYQALLLVVAALYGLAWWLGQRGGLAISPAR
ncbi:MAG: spermidine synthase [Chloroflexota bacterium]